MKGDTRSLDYGSYRGWVPGSPKLGGNNGESHGERDRNRYNMVDDRE